MSKEKKFSFEGEIDFLGVINKLFINRNTIIIYSFLFMVIGIIYSLFLPNIYRSSSTFYPHYEKIDNSNDLKSLAGLAGINFETEFSNNIPTNLYPKLVSSTNFKEKILNEKVFINDQEIT